MKLNTLIEENRVKCKAKVRDLTQVMGGAEEMSRHMGDMDPYVLSLLIKEQTPSKKGTIAEEDEEEEEVSD